MDAWTEYIWRLKTLHRWELIDDATIDAIKGLSTLEELKIFYESVVSKLKMETNPESQGVRCLACEKAFGIVS